MVIREIITDGKLVKFDKKETVLAQNPQLVAEIKQIIKNNKETIRSLPKEINNLYVLDGAEEEIKLGIKRFSGSNIMTVKITQEKIDAKRDKDAVVWMTELFKIQEIMEEIEKVVGEVLN